MGNETLETREFEFGSAARAVVSPGRSDPAFSPVTAVFLECRQHLRSFVARFLPRAYDIDDIVQEVFLRAYITERTQLVHAPKAFLFCIAKNLSLKEIARRVRHGPGGNTPPSVSEDLPEVASHEPPLEDQLEGQEKLVAFCRAVASLPPQCRHAFLMRKLYDLSYKEIADELGVTVRTVEKHVAAGLERCGTYLHRLGYELEGPIRAASGESPGKATRTR